jgi:hypothetical protein
MNLTFELHDWRVLERIVGLIGRLGCALTSVDVRTHNDRYHATFDLTGAPDALRRLDAQLTRLCNDDKEMSR